MAKLTTTEQYTNVARTAVVTAGHGIAIAGAAAEAAGCPLGESVKSVGDAIAQTAIDQCSRDTPGLNECNHG